MIIRVRLCDLSSYDPMYCNNGGSYSFTVNYIRTGPDTWDVEHTTSADFDYCRYCGTFTNMNDGKCSHCGDVQQTVSTERLIDEINKWYKMGPDYHVEYDSNSVETGNDMLLLKALESSTK